MTSKKPTERQVRWSQLLSEYNFILNFRAGKNSGVPDALSRKSQNMPKDNSDPRLRKRKFQLIKSEWLKPIVSNDVVNISPIDSSQNNIPCGDNLFDDISIQNMWDKGVKEDRLNLYTLYKTLWNEEKNFPSELDIKISRSECEFD